MDSGIGSSRQNFCSQSVGFTQSSQSYCEQLRRSVVVKFREQFVITFKFGGVWVGVRNQDRRRYDGGKQKTVKLEKELICLTILREEIERICPWLQGHAFELHHHIHGSSPKEYKLLGSDVETRKMLEQCNGVGRTEMMK